MPIIPEWTPDELMIVRKAARSGLSPAEVKAMLNSPLSVEGVRGRAKRYHITFDQRRTAHQGNSKLSIPYLDQREAAKQQRAAS